MTARFEIRPIGHKQKDDEKFEVRRLDQRWYWVHDIVIRGYARQIGKTAFMVYSLLASFSDKQQECWPSYAKIGITLGISDDTVKRSIRILEQYRLVRVVRGRGRGHMTRYCILKASREPRTRGPRSQPGAGRHRQGVVSRPPYLWPGQDRHLTTPSLSGILP